MTVATGTGEEKSESTAIELLHPVIKDQWLEALRSGEYKQARGCLCVGRGAKSWHDALGVLYDVGFDGDWHQVPGGDPPKWLTSEWSLWMSKNLSERPLLPSGQASAMGLSLGEQIYLARMNDDGKSFVEIADWIETYL